MLLQVTMLILLLLQISGLVQQELTNLVQVNLPALMHQQDIMSLVQHLQLKLLALQELTNLILVNHLVQMLLQATM